MAEFLSAVAGNAVGDALLLAIFYALGFRVVRRQRRKARYPR